MRLTEIRWAGDPAGSISFHPRLTVVCDLPHDPTTGSIGFVLASLTDRSDGVFDVEPGELAEAATDASEGVVRLDAPALADAWRELVRRRARRARAELERGRDVLREEDAVLAGRTRARRRARDDLSERRESATADLAARRAELADSVADCAAVEAALRCLDEVENAEAMAGPRPTDALAERWIDLTTAIAFLGADMPNVRTFAEGEQALATARPDQRREDSVGQISVADAEALHRVHQEVERAERRAQRVLAGRGARRALADARAAERELLDRLGFNDYGQYLASVAFDAETADVDEAESSAVRAAEDRLAQATALHRADLEHWEQLEGELRDVRSEVRELLGGEPTDDPLRALQGRAARSQRLEAALAALADALAQVGVAVPDGSDEAPTAREWLEREQERRADLEAKISGLEAHAVRERSEIDARVEAVESELDALAGERDELVARLEELQGEIDAFDREQDGEQGSLEQLDLGQLGVADVDETFVLALPRIGDPEWAWPLVVDHALDELADPVRTKACERLATRARAQQVVIVTDEDAVQEWASRRHVGTVARWPPAPPEPEVAEDDGDPAPEPVEEADPELVVEANARSSEASIDLVVDGGEGRETPPPPDPTTVMLRCTRHWHLRASTRCSRCQEPFCDRCLVTVGRGREARVLCVDCALSAAGVRVRHRRRR